MKRMHVIIPLLCLLFFPMAADEIPVKTEDFLYIIRAFDGSDYENTFSGGFSNEIYLLAQSDNFISFKKTFTYFWPTTDEWKIDNQHFDVPFSDGIIEIRKDGRVIHSLHSEDYVQVKIREMEREVWQTYSAETSAQLYSEYHESTEAYYEAMRGWQIAESERRERIEWILEEIKRRKDKDGDTTQLLEEIDRLNKPIPEPKREDKFIVRPFQIANAYRINIPPGRYDIRYRDADGQIMEGSEKELICYEAESKADIGFNLIPGDKWTRVVKSEHNGSVIYLNGETSLYLQAFTQNSYPELHYNKTENNQATGRIALFRHEMIQQLTEMELILQSNEGPFKLSLNGFKIEQIPGAALGYRILPTRETADLTAFAISADYIRANPRIAITLPGKKGDRQIRLLNQMPSLHLLLFCLFFPIMMYSTVQILRRRRKRP